MQLDNMAPYPIKLYNYLLSSVTVLKMANNYIV